MFCQSERQKRYSMMQSYPNYKIYIAKYNDEIVGTFSLSIMDNISHLGKCSGLIESVVVRKDMRSKGIGRKMMEYAFEICRKNNCYKMNLSSNLKRERAHKFYENLGFEKHGYSFSIEFTVRTFVRLGLLEKIFLFTIVNKGGRDGSPSPKADRVQNQKFSIDSSFRKGI